MGDGFLSSLRDFLRFGRLPSGEYDSSLSVFNEQRDVVAQICNLPYRRFVIGKTSKSSGALSLTDGPQNAILRYRLQICATPKASRCVIVDDSPAFRKSPQDQREQSARRALSERQLPSTTDEGCVGSKQ